MLKQYLNYNYETPLNFKLNAGNKNVKMNVY
jgi:hypothetical protein